MVEVAHVVTGIVIDTTIDKSWDSDAEAWNIDLTRWDEQLFNASQQSLVLASTDETTPTDSKLLEVDIGPDFDGVPITGLLQKLEMHFDEPDRLKLVKRCHPKINANPGTEITFRIGGSDIIGGPITWSPPTVWTQGVTERLDLFAQGRYISFEASSTGLQPWQLVGFDLEMELRGYH